jgi:hypothetical protein
MKSVADNMKRKHHRNAAKLHNTIIRINAALQILMSGSERYDNISHLAKTVAEICGLDRSLLLRNDKAYRTCLDSYPALLKGYRSENTLFNEVIDPLHPEMIRKAELEKENSSLRIIINDLTERTARATSRHPKSSNQPFRRGSPTPVPTEISVISDITDDSSADMGIQITADAEAPSRTVTNNPYQYQYELTCQLVNLILESRPAFKIIDNALIDVANLRGPQTIAGADIVQPFLKWKKGSTHDK